MHPISKLLQLTVFLWGGGRTYFPEAAGVKTEDKNYSIEKN